MLQPEDSEICDEREELLNAPVSKFNMDYIKYGSAFKHLYISKWCNSGKPCYHYISENLGIDKELEDSDILLVDYKTIQTKLIAYSIPLPEHFRLRNYHCGQKAKEKNLAKTAKTEKSGWCCYIL
jgi:hypothetical protein